LINEVRTYGFVPVCGALVAELNPAFVVMAEAGSAAWLGFGRLDFALDFSAVVVKGA